MKKANLFMALGLTLAMGTALAGNKIDRECSPGFYHNKNGLAYWWAACQSAGSVTVEGVTLTCSETLAALTAGRNADLGMGSSINDYWGAPPGVVHNLVADAIVRDFLGGSDNNKAGAICDD